MLKDPEIDRLMAMSGEELKAEARADGIDLDGLTRDMAQQFQVIARLVRERDAAREGVVRLRAALVAVRDIATESPPGCSYCEEIRVIADRSLE